MKHRSQWTADELLRMPSCRGAPIITVDDVMQSTTAVDLKLIDGVWQVPKQSA